MSLTSSSIDFVRQEYFQFSWTPAYSSDSLGVSYLTTAGSKETVETLMIRISNPRSETGKIVFSIEGAIDTDVCYHLLLQTTDARPTFEGSASSRYSCNHTIYTGKFEDIVKEPLTVTLRKLRVASSALRRQPPLKAEVLKEDILSSAKYLYDTIRPFLRLSDEKAKLSEAAKSDQNDNKTTIIRKTDGEPSNNSEGIIVQRSQHVISKTVGSCSAITPRPATVEKNGSFVFSSSFFGEIHDNLEPDFVLVCRKQIERRESCSKRIGHEDETESNEKTEDHSTKEPKAASIENPQAESKESLEATSSEKNLPTDTSEKTQVESPRNPEELVEIPVNSFLLCARCSVFRAYLRRGMFVENSTGRIMIDDLSPEVMQSFADFVHFDRCKLLEDADASISTVVQLMRAANKYDCQSLHRRCVEYLCSRLNHQNSIELLLAGYENKAGCLANDASLFLDSVNTTQFLQLLQSIGTTLFRASPQTAGRAK